MSTKVGSIHYELDLDDDSYNKKTDKASAKWDSLGSKIGGVGVGVAKAAGVALLAAGTAVAGIATASVKAYADYEQLSGGVKKLFGDMSNDVIKNSEQAYQTAGMSANDYMQTVTGFSARLLQSLGDDTSKAAEIADRAVRDMSDNANTFGTDIALIQNAYQGFAKGNFTMLDNLKLGYGGTAGEMARLVNESGVMGKGFKATAENINSIGFDKYIEAIHKIQEQTKITGTTSLEASKTISGSISSMKASWTNLLSTLASGDNDAVTTALDNLASSLGNVVSNISAIIPNILSGIVSVIEQAATSIDLSVIINSIISQLPKIIELALTLVSSLVKGIRDNLPLIMKSAISIITTLVKGVLGLLPQILLTGIQIIISLLNGIAEALPEIIPAIVDTVIFMVTTLVENLPLIIQAGLQVIIALIEGLVEAIPNLIQFIPSILESIVTAIIKALPMIIVAALQIILALAKGLIVAIPQLVVMIPQIILAISKALISGTGEMIKSGGSLIAGLWEGIKDSTTWIKNKITSWVGDVMKFIKKLFGIGSPSKLMETQVGFNLGAGVANGITKSIGLVKDAMGTIGDTVGASINPIIEPTVNMGAIPSVMQGVGLNDLQRTSESVKTINQDININIDKINDNQDLNALANQLGFRASLLPI